VAAAVPQPTRESRLAVAVYIPVRVAQRLADRATLEKQWESISRQVKVDKVCRSR
jgi:hypothetical protein